MTRFQFNQKKILNKMRNTKNLYAYAGDSKVLKRLLLKIKTTVYTKLVV